MGASSNKFTIVWLNLKIKPLNFLLANYTDSFRIKDAVNVSFRNNSHKLESEVNFAYNSRSKFSINATELPRDSDFMVPPSCHPALTKYNSDCLSCYDNLLTMKQINVLKFIRNAL
jgi:hypothetical protein